jgi:hypothetical protein
MCPAQIYSKNRFQKVKVNAMKNLTGLCVGLCVVFGCGAMVAQDMPAGPPKVLVIEREWLKTGKTDSMHQKTESAFVNAMTAAKWPTHYFAAESMSGKPRVLFFVGYPSFEAWEKDNHAVAKNATLSAAWDRAEAADGELLEDFQQDVLVFNPDLSLHTRDIAHDRYFEISRYQVKPGKRAEFLELVKMYVEGYGKASEHANWATFESYYGQDNGGVYIAVSVMASLAENDTFMGDDAKFAKTMGPEKMKKIGEMTADCLESSMTNLYEFKPGMSYPDESWIKADPFWKPKSAMAAAKKPAAAAPAGQ